MDEGVKEWEIGCDSCEWEVDGEGKRVEEATRIVTCEFDVAWQKKSEMWRLETWLDKELEVCNTLFQKKKVPEETRMNKAGYVGKVRIETRRSFPTLQEGARALLRDWEIDWWKNYQ